MAVLVTGGAGYIGSVIVEELLKLGREVAVIDNLKQGHLEAVTPGARFVQGDIGSSRDLDGLFEKYTIEAVMHLAADSIVSSSVADPQPSFQNNLVAGLNLLNSMRQHGVGKLIFSSSAAVYGEPLKIPIEEDHPQIPVNPYGETKLIFEKILRWYSSAYGLKYICLRYFNAAGASLNLGEDHHPETHLIPNVLKAVLDGQSPLSIFGRDYPTKDGSCVRDYVHVIDIAQAHIQALARIDALSGRAYNLGSGSGYSILEVVKAAERVCGTTIPIADAPRRAGDPASLVASSESAKSQLGWQPRFVEIEQIVESAWNWTKAHPNGYGN